MSHSADILIVTVNKNEARAVLNAFAKVVGTKGTVFNEGNYAYHNLGKLNGQRVVMVQSEIGSVGLGSSLQTVQEAVATLNPSAVMMVGVAFGMNPDKQAIGQVLVAKQIISYEQQKITPSQIIPRGPRVDVATRLLNHLRTADLKRDDDNPKVSFGLIVSGEKLVDNLPFREQLKDLEPEAIGGEMEGAGLYAACQKAKVDWILVKGICDWAEHKDNPNKEKDQQLAAKNSATFVVHALQMGQLVEPKKAQLSTGKSLSSNSGKMAKVTIIHRGNLADFDEETRKKIVAEYARIAEVEEHEIEIISVKDGSVILVLRMPMAGAKRLLNLWKRKFPALLAMGVTDLSLDSGDKDSIISVLRERSDAKPPENTPARRLSKLQRLVFGFVSENPGASVQEIGRHVSKVMGRRVSYRLVRVALDRLSRKGKLRTLISRKSRKKQIKRARRQARRRVEKRGSGVPSVKRAAD